MNAAEALRQIYLHDSHGAPPSPIKTEIIPRLGRQRAGGRLSLQIVLASSMPLR
jgi:hypothetical protein